MMTPEEQNALIALARAAIARGFSRRGAAGPAVAAPDWPFPAGGPTGLLARPGGAFVTLRENGELRGCIGYIESELPLWQVVEEVAEKAAFQDPRFRSLAPWEFERITVEVSVLSPPEPMGAPGQITVGLHGLIIEHEGRRGLLLPQVATEYGWDREEFLEHVCRKAGLRPGAWRQEGARVFLFRADVIEEAHHA
jgi:AmmeMemoRadiSam system protein A